jgi:hypothetical protein
LKSAYSLVRPIRAAAQASAIVYASCWVILAHPRLLTLAIRERNAEGSPNLQDGLEGLEFPCAII